MHKATKIFLIVVAMLVAVAGVLFAVESYAFNNPRIAITFYTSGEGDVNVYTIPQLSFEPRGLTGVCDKWDDRYFEIMDVINEMLYIAKSHADEEPWFFDSRVETDGEKTIFVLQGYYTRGGEKVEVNEIFKLDYVVTRDIARH